MRIELVDIFLFHLKLFTSSLYIVFSNEIYMKLSIPYEVDSFFSVNFFVVENHPITMFFNGDCSSCSANGWL